MQLAIDIINTKRIFMKTNPLNLCSICINNTACVLTHAKEKVWSCSDFEESTTVYKHKNTEPNFALASA